MSRTKRQLADWHIRALAYEVAAEEIQASAGNSDLRMSAIENARGSAADDDALNRQLTVIVNRLRRRAREIRYGKIPPPAGAAGKE